MIKLGIASSFVFTHQHIYLYYKGNRLYVSWLTAYKAEFNFYHRWEKRAHGWCTTVCKDDSWSVRSEANCVERERKRLRVRKLSLLLRWVSQAVEQGQVTFAPSKSFLSQSSSRSHTGHAMQGCASSTFALLIRGQTEMKTWKQCLLKARWMRLSSGCSLSKKTYVSYARNWHICADKTSKHMYLKKEQNRTAADYI